MGVLTEMGVKWDAGRVKGICVDVRERLWITQTKRFYISIAQKNQKIVPSLTCGDKNLKQSV
jgi:hypothetical protein